MRKLGYALAIAGLVGIGALAYFSIKKKEETATLTVTNPQASYSRSSDEIVLAELVVVGTSPFEVQYWVNSTLFHTETGFIASPFKFGFWVRENADWGFTNGANSIYFVVTDADGEVATSNTITFIVAP